MDNVMPCVCMALPSDPAITILASHIIKPSTPTSTSPPSLPLSAFDLMLATAQYNQRILLFHLHASRFHTALHTLNHSLSQALSHFYPLAGTLHLSPEGRIHVLCNDAGVEFIEASTSLTLPQMLDPQKPSLLLELAPKRHALSMDGFHLPLLIVQATQLREDGMALGMTVNHLLVDGRSNWHFINSWARICREAVDSIPVSPVYDRSLILDPTCRVPAASGLGPHLKRDGPSLPSDASLQETVFHFTAEAMAELKKRANKSRVEGMKPFSSYQALTAHLWKCITSARGLSPDETCYHRLVVDARGRIVPPLPPAYFGNVIVLATIKSTVRFIEGAELGEVAGLIHEAIEAMDGMKVREIVWHSRDEKIWGFKNLVHVGSSFKFPAYEADFGWGRPVAVRSGGSNKCDGKITFFPGGEGGGSVDAEIVVDEESMKRLEIIV